MSIHIETLRDLAANHGHPVCDEVTDEIEDMEKAYELLFKENAELKAALTATGAAQGDGAAAISFPFRAAGRVLRRYGHAQGLLRAIGKNMRAGGFGDHDAMELVASYLDALEFSAQQEAPAAQPLSDEQIDAATASARDALLDHIYEYGTAAEGMQRRVRAIARAAIGTQPAATKGTT